MPTTSTSVAALVESPRGLTFGRYRAIAELARGGMGIVYLALSTGPGGFAKLFAVKELRPSLCGDPEVVALFLREARVAGRLGHPNVVQTLEVATDGPRHYMVMEHLDGQPLHRIAKRFRRADGGMPLGFGIAVLSAALEGLEYVHTAADLGGSRLGMIHRDVSPQNLFVGYSGQVKLIDFGIAKAVNAVRETATGIIKGKIHYMAPEQVTGGFVGPAADTFSVGVMLWELVTGRRLWSGAGHDFQIVQALAAGRIPIDEDAAMRRVPTVLQQVVRRALAADVAARYPTAVELQTDLRAAAESLGEPLFDPPRLAVAMRALFARDRIRAKAAIDAHIREALEEAGSEVTPLFDGRSSLAPTFLAAPSSGTVAVHDREATRPDSEASMQSTRIERPRSSRPPARTIPYLALASAALLALLFAPVAVRRLRESDHASPRTAASSIPALASAPPVTLPPTASTPAEAPLSGRVSIRIDVPKARVSLDGMPIQNKSYVAMLPADGTRHLLRTETRGARPRDSSFVVEGDLDILVTRRPRGAKVSSSLEDAAAPSPRDVGAKATVLKVLL